MMVEMMRRALLVAVALNATSAHGAQTASPRPITNACLVASRPVEGQAYRLSVHPDAATLVVATGPPTGIGRPVGLRAIDLARKTDIVMPPLGLNGTVVWSPSGRTWAYSVGGSEGATLHVGPTGTTSSRACATARFVHPIGFAIDDRFALATTIDGNEHGMVICDPASVATAAWLNTTPFERLRELATPRFHGSAPWAVLAARVSTDGQRILSAREDRQIVVWSRSGERLRALTAPARPEPAEHLAVGDDGSVLYVVYDVTDRDDESAFRVVDLASGVTRYRVTSRFTTFPLVTPDRVQFFPTTQGYVVAYLEQRRLVLARAHDGRPMGEIPVAEPVTMFSVGSDGATIALAHPGRVAVWRLVDRASSCGAWP